MSDGNSDELILANMKKYFTSLRTNKGHLPNSYQISREICAVLKFSLFSQNEKNFLFNCGLVFFPNNICSIHSAKLADVMCCCKSRLNNGLKKEAFEVITTPVTNEKNVLLKNIKNQENIKMWSFRKFGNNTQLLNLIKSNERLITEAPSGLSINNTQNQKKENESSLVLSFHNVYSWTYEDDLFVNT